MDRPTRGFNARTAAAMGAALVLIVALLAMGRAGLYGTGLWIEGGTDTIDPAIFLAEPEGNDANALPAKPSGGVLGEADPEAGTVPQQVSEMVASVGPVTGQMFGLVIDGATGDTLYSKTPDLAGTPASTQKVLTALVALDHYGPDHRFQTRVLRDPVNPQKIYLVGGGDPYLMSGPAGGTPARASILTLAAETSQEVNGPVEVVVDNSLFAGPGWNPEWRAVYRDYAAETSALWVDQARATGAAVGPRHPNPPQMAADAFTKELQRLGVQVATTTPGTAPANAAAVAEVASMPLENIVEKVLIESDNDAAEVLFRHVGRAGGRSGSIIDSRAAMEESLRRLGVWTDGMEIADGSGLARSNATSPTALTRAVLLGVSDERPELRALATGMSVAGVEGTLAVRFVEDGTEAGRGLVRAKTGTLTEVHSLAGYVQDEDGALLIYSFIVNGQQDEYATRVWLDKVTSALQTCGCK